MGGKKRGLRACVLGLLRSRPMNGAEMMDEMDRATHGWWRPSPGSIYPLLEDLAQEGTVRKRPDGRYELVKPPDTTNWEWSMGGPRSVQDVVVELSGLTRYLDDLKHSDRAALHDFQKEIEKVADQLKMLIQEGP
ncbi:MAG: PadR family transcriptional regulator [Thermoplasmata archaeon]